MPPLIQLSSSNKQLTADKHLIEDSIALRVVTTLMAVLGIAIAANLTESPLWLLSFSTGGCVIGSWYSYRMRYHKNIIGKIWISVGILVVAGLFFNELVLRIYANVADARTPLTQMLMALMALHSFDLPRRRDLSLSAVVGFILITSSSTLSRDFSFLAYSSIFFLLTIIMFQLDCKSRTKSRAFINMRGEDALAQPSEKKPVSLQNAKQVTIGVQSASWKRTAATLTLLGIALLICTLGCFAVLPRVQVSIFKQIRFGNGSNLPFLGKISAPDVSVSQLFSPDGSIKSLPTSYFGFSESLDTNYRGKLGDKVVLRVQGGTGNYLRGMAYDTFDGKTWTMSLPNKTVDCNAAVNQSFQIPTRSAFFPKVRYKELMQVIYVEEDSSNLVVYTNLPYQVYFPASRLQVDTYGAIRSPAGVQKDMVYTVFSNVPFFDFSKLRKQPAWSSEKRKDRWLKRLQAYLQVPNLDPRVATLARSTAGDGGDYAKAERLCNYLMSHFKYDLDVSPTEPGRDTVSDFVFEKKRGYCEHFASSLTMMCRTQGIPARLVTGYAPGNYNPFTGFWDVRLCDAHSWTEVFIEGAGWVPLDATPGGMGSSYQGQEQSSVVDFIEAKIIEGWTKFSESPVGKDLATGVNALVTIIAKAAYAFTSNLNNILVSCTILGIATSIAIWRVKEFRQLAKAVLGRLHGREPLSTELQLHAAASDEYLKFLKLLENFGVKRQPGDTVSDIMQKLYLCSRSAELEEIAFFEAARLFAQTYSRVRFGATDELSELKVQSARLHDLAEKLTALRSSASIS